MATPTVLGLDIGGANLKAATRDKRAASVPFALWKQPDKLPAALADLVAKFPDAEELAVTMTGELCDCFETKRDGVAAILAAVRFASGGRRIRVWSTDGVFVTADEAKADHLKVAAANWHALATFAGQYTFNRPGILIDTGSTTTDVIPLLHGKPMARGRTDRERLRSGELVYTGVRRTPVAAVLGSTVAAEYFATTHDAYLLLGKVAEDPADRDTADGRPATLPFAHARLARMIGGDAETVTREEAAGLAEEVMDKQIRLIEYGIAQAGGTLRSILRASELPAGVRFVVSGSGEFVLRELFARGLKLDRDVVGLGQVRSLTDQLGPAVSACAPAYAVAVLAAESRS
ncbi:MAG: H4MPT-linked C1 transfer pathway protein [Isosphaera sp.]|nr:H4MPT-linked C1 transfer pathway protein [Isosphaera sp.]